MFSKKSNFLTPSQQSAIEYFMARNTRKKRSKVSVSRSMKAIQNFVVKTVEAQQFSFVVTDVGLSDGTTTSNGLTWTFCQNNPFYSNSAGLQTLPNYLNASAYAQIYDQYRIIKVDIDMYYSANSNTNNSSTTLSNLSLPIMYGVVDYDDSDLLSNETGALAYSTCQVFQFGNSSGTNNGRQTKHLQKPTVLTESSLPGGSATASQLTVSPWLSTDLTTQAHYGIKFYMSSSLPTPSVKTNLGYLTFIIRQFVEYRNIR
jgi:hypothetical protein